MRAGLVFEQRQINGSHLVPCFSSACGCKLNREHLLPRDIDWASLPVRTDAGMRALIDESLRKGY